MNLRRFVRLHAVLAVVLVFALSVGQEAAHGESAQQRRAEVLARVDDGCDAVRQIVAALEDPSATVRRTAVHALQRVACAPAYTALKGALGHDDAEVRRLAMDALGPAWVMGHHLVEALTDEDPVVRNWVGQQLGAQPLRIDDDGFKVEATVRFDELPTDRNAQLVHKWDAGADKRTFMIFYRRPHLRFSVTADGQSADTVLTGRIEAGVTYDLIAVFDPHAEELSLTLETQDGTQSWTERTEIEHAYASDQPIGIGGGAFKGDIFRVAILPVGAARHLAGETARERRDAALAYTEHVPEGVAILEAALDDESPLVRRTAAHALGEAGGALAHEALRVALDHDDPEVRRLAMKGLGPQWLLRHYLAEALADPDPVVNNWVRLHLGEHPPRDEAEWEAVRAPLAEALAHKRVLTRHRAVMLCSHWEEAPDRLGDLLDAAAGDDEALVREAAQEVMWPFERPRQSSRERFADASLSLVEEVPLPVDAWRFRTEGEGEAGHLRDWFEPEHDDGDWDRVEIERFWGEVGYDGYVGVAWYRRSFDAPSQAYDAAELHFGAVDESAWVWLNGAYASQHDIGAAGWDTPFSIDVTDLIQWGERNHITVRVRNTMAAGGIHKPIVLRLYEKQ